MLPKNNCKLEITEDYHGNKIVTYPNCEQEELKFTKDCNTFDDCYDHIKDEKYKTLFALGVYSDTTANLEAQYQSCTTATTLIIPKNTIITNRYGKYAQKAYVYDHAQTYVNDEGDVRKFNNDTRYQNVNLRIRIMRNNSRGAYAYLTHGNTGNNNNLLIFKKGEEVKLINKCNYKLEHTNGIKLDEIKDYIKFYH
jgi:hypothetical protein